MPINILELGPSSPSNVVLVGNAQTLRDYLMSKNLPSIPSDVTIAGLDSQWFNGGPMVTQYEVTDPLPLTNPGDVFTWDGGSSDAIRNDVAINNLYNYNDVYFGPTFTQYHLVNIDDTNISIIGAGNIEEYYDPDEASHVLSTWDNRWNVDLNRNTYSPGHIGYFYSETDSWTHSTAENTSGIQQISDTNISLPFLSDLYSISNFISVLDNTEYSNLVYLSDIVTAYNRYGSTTYWLDILTGNLINSPDAAYFSYNDIAENTNILGTVGTINATNDNIDDWSNTNGNPGSGDQYYETNHIDALTYLINRNRYGTVETLGSVPLIGSNYYNNLNVLVSFNGNTFVEVGAESINSDNSDINTFNVDVDLREVGGGLWEGSGQFSPSEFRNDYCANYNLYGGPGGITNTYEKERDDWKDFIRDNRAGFCLPYISEPLDPFIYATENADKFEFSIINPLEPSIKAQENVFVYSSGDALSFNNYGVLTDINSLIGNIIGTAPLPVDAILNQFGNDRKDTPLGNLGRQKLASEFTFRLKQNIRKETLGKAEQFAQGVGQAASTFIGSLFNKEDTVSQAGKELKESISDLFRNYEITVPKSIVGKVADFAASLSGINPKTDNQ